MRTVCEEVERALAVVLRVPSVSLTVAGRTDAGVHAWGQVASYAGPPVEVRSLNAVLPSDVAALDCCEALPGFDARRDATSRAYCYRVLARGPRSAFERGRALYWPHRLDLAALRACAGALGRGPRLHGVHADRHRARAVLPRGVRGRVAGARRRRARVLDRGRRVHAPDDPGARGDDARGRWRPAVGGVVFRVALLGGRGRAPAGPRRRTVCTWRASGTVASECCTCDVIAAACNASAAESLLLCNNRGRGCGNVARAAALCVDGQRAPCKAQQTRRAALQPAHISMASMLMWPGSCRWGRFGALYRVASAGAPRSHGWRNSNWL